MTELFAMLYLDENMPIVLAPLIQARGFFATTAHTEGLLGAKDPDHLQFSTAVTTVVLTPHIQVHLYPSMLLAHDASVD